MQPIQSFVEFVYLMLLSIHQKTWWLLHKYLLLEVAIQERRLDVHVVDFPAFRCNQGNQKVHSFHTRHRSEDLIEVDAMLLHISLGDESSFELGDEAGFIVLGLIDPLEADRSHSPRCCSPQWR